MNEFQATTVFIAFFALRCVVPLLLTVAIGAAMNYLVDRWEAEEKAATPGEVGVSVVAKPAVRLADIPVAAIPCWLVKKCNPSDCPAYQQQEIPCWLARMRTEGKLPAACLSCELYTPREAVAGF
ncbi:MAG TPA: hypothetical protein VF177_07390 [Anaerolineae bacterium]